MISLGVFRNGDRPPVHLAFAQARKADGALARVVCDGVGEERQPLLFRHLPDDLGLADARRSHQAHGACATAVDAVAPVCILGEIERSRLRDRGLGLRDGHLFHDLSFHNYNILSCTPRGRSFPFCTPIIRQGGIQN